uniref:EGF-like domain-containing protein n=1 Tax=Parascaris univalens TaxID=6257 RepID=A0A915B3C9_PARUN
NAQCAEGWSGINCFEDVDECLTEVHQCSAKAKCVNTLGSYKCECNEPFVGDGFTCKQIDACYHRLNEKCSTNAVCDEAGIEGPECVCNEGYHGDGLNCLPIDRPSERPAFSDGENTITGGPISMPGNVGHDDGFEETPFMMHNWITEQGYPKTTPLKPRKRPVTPGAPVAKDYNDIEGDVYAGGRTLEETDGGSMWFIIVPIALCGIWAISIAVIVAVCCRKKRRSSKFSFKEPVGMTGWSSHNIR